MYSEVLDLIVSYENGFANFLKEAYEKNDNTPIRLSEANLLFTKFEEMTTSIYGPLKEKARSLMATRDMAFRDALLLEELRQVNSKLTSFTGILMELHEEKTSLKADTTEKLIERLRAVQMSLQSIPSQIQIPLKEITQLNQSLDLCTAQLQQPIQQVVKHHIAKIWIVAAGLLLTVVILIYFLLDSRSQLKQYEAGEIKYRYLKLVSNPNLQQLLFYTDSLYRLKPDSFKVAVLQKEAEEELQLKLLQEAKGKEQEAKQLRRRAGQSKRQK